MLIYAGACWSWRLRRSGEPDAPEGKPEFAPVIPLPATAVGSSSELDVAA